MNINYFKKFPKAGILSTSLGDAIIERNGIIDAIEKDSRKPFNSNKKIKKYNCLFLFLLKKKIVYIKGLF